MKEFNTPLLRGNTVDLAAAVVIDAAFGTADTFDKTEASNEDWTREVP